MQIFFPDFVVVVVVSIVLFPGKKLFTTSLLIRQIFFYCRIVVGVSTKKRHWELIQNNCYKRIQALICCRTLFIWLFMAVTGERGRGRWREKKERIEWQTCLILMSGTNASNRKASVDMTLNTRAIICQGRRLAGREKKHSFKKEMRDLPFDVEGWSEFQRSEKFANNRSTQLCMCALCVCLCIFLSWKKFEKRGNVKPTSRLPANYMPIIAKRKCQQIAVDHLAV